VARDNVLTGASIWSGGLSAAIDGNELHRGFISVGGEGSYRITNNHVDELRYDVGPGIAISAWDHGEVEIIANTVTNSDTGIKTLFFGGTALIDGNTVESTRTGISVGGSNTTVSNNTIEASDIIGLEVYNAGPTLTGNSISGGGTGLHLATTGAATASDNTICDNRTNVRVVSGELPDLSGNDICEDDTD
jgi:parallel beta-helix repeat protein